MPAYAAGPGPQYPAGGGGYPDQYGQPQYGAYPVAAAGAASPGAAPASYPGQPPGNMAYGSAAWGVPEGGQYPGRPVGYGQYAGGGAPGDAVKPGPVV
jgi:hypothetical protein